jgi:hypothetical protein
MSEVAEAHTLLPREPFWILFVTLASRLKVELKRVGAGPKFPGARASTSPIAPSARLT